MEKVNIRFLAGENLASEYRRAAKLMSESEQPFSARVDISTDGVGDNKVVVDISFVGELPQTTEGSTDIRALRIPLDKALHEIQNPVA